MNLLTAPPLEAIGMAAVVNALIASWDGNSLHVLAAGYCYP